MPDDPRDILKAAGVECAEVDAHWPEPFCRNESGDAAILALARLVAKYKWQRDKCAAFPWDCSDHKTEEDCVTDVTNELDRRWEKHHA